MISSNPFFLSLASMTYLFDHFQLVSESREEHHYLTGPSGQILRPPQKPPHISTVLSEYMEVCMEDHCAIGE